MIVCFTLSFAITGESGGGGAFMVMGPQRPKVACLPPAWKMVGRCDLKKVTFYN